jgi:hypothetical protein
MSFASIIYSAAVAYIFPVPPSFDLSESAQFHILLDRRV